MQMKLMHCRLERQSRRCRMIARPFLRWSSMPHYQPRRFWRVPLFRTSPSLYPYFERRHRQGSLSECSAQTRRQPSARNLQLEKPMDFRWGTLDRQCKVNCGVHAAGQVMLDLGAIRIENINLKATYTFNPPPPVETACYSVYLAAKLTAIAAVIFNGTKPSILFFKILEKMDVVELYKSVFAETFQTTFVLSLTGLCMCCSWNPSVLVLAEAPGHIPGDAARTFEQDLMQLLRLMFWVSVPSSQK